VYPTGSVEATPVAELSGSTIPYLFPSRFCQSDRDEEVAIREVGDPAR
jgi:hypothetical protein